jgi:ribosome-associated toxin RatA of RatAB toxin-antitoxin module
MGLLSFKKKTSAVIPGDPELVYEILTDYDSYCEWMPLIAESRLLAKEGDLALAEFELTRPRKEKFVIESIHTRNTMVLIRTISGKVPINQMEWTISPSAQGVAVSLIVQSRTSVARFVPAYRRLIDPGACMAGLKGQLAAFSPDLGLTSAEGEKVFELSETEQGLVCWVRGKKYILTPAPEGKK